MSLTKKLLPLAVSAAIAVPMMFGATTASADVSATLGANSMYLWRGLNLTPDGPQVHGSLDYSMGGFYAGAWMTNETSGSETDLYFGFGGEVGKFGYDISYWKYLYPEERDEDSVRIDLGDSDYSELVISGSFGPVTAAAYIGVEDSDDPIYYTIGVDVDKFNVTYGFWDIDGGSVDTEEAEEGTDEYSHLTGTYAFNDNINFGVSFAFSDLSDDDPAGVEEDPLFFVGYSKSFDLK